MRNITKCIIFCLIAGTIIFSIDYYVDAYAAVRVTYDKIAHIAQNHNYYVGTQIPLSERKPKWAYINIMEKKQYIVMGSSRSEMFTSENMGEKSFYNLCVSAGCTIEDYLAEVYILYSQNKLPDELLIEVSPSIFNKNNERSNWKEWGDNTKYMKQLLSNQDPGGKQPGLGIQWRELLSPSYFQYNVQNLKENKRIWIGSGDDYDNLSYLTVHMDGSYMYSRNYQNKYTEEQILQETENICNTRAIYSCDGYEEIDDELRNTFEEIIEFLVENGVEVYFYLPPYSAPMYDFISTDDGYKVIMEVEDYILSFASENRLKVFGSYDPKGSGLYIKDLYDPYHVREEKVADTLWER